MKAFTLALMALVATSEAVKINKFEGALPAQFDVAQGGDPFMSRII